MIAAEIANEWVYVGLAWGISAAAVGGYAVSLIRRGRRLSQRVPEESRRWM